MPVLSNRLTQMHADPHPGVREERIVDLCHRKTANPCNASAVLQQLSNLAQQWRCPRQRKIPGVDVGEWHATVEGCLSSAQNLGNLLLAPFKLSLSAAGQFVAVPG